MLNGAHSNAVAVYPPICAIDAPHLITESERGQIGDVVDAAALTDHSDRCTELDDGGFCHATSWGPTHAGRL